MDIVEALDAESGLVCVVGAGGKKSTLYALAERLDRAVVTATVRIPIFDSRVADLVVAEDPVAALGAVDEWPVGLVPEREREDRYRGYDPAVVDDLAAALRAEADAAPESPPPTVLVKADGARTRWLKAPNEREPQLPRTADVVVPIASARVVGEPFSEDVAHRPERIAAITGLSPGEEIGADDVAAVLAGDEGGMKDVPSDATVVPLVNMADDPALEAVARDVAERVLDRVDVPRVVLSRMVADEPLVGVVT
ncbi:MAG: selenium cofactor biosynthesis protein YqeC [Salinigranum sp.]